MPVASVTLRPRQEISKDRFQVRRRKTFGLKRTYRGPTTLAQFTFPFFFFPLPAIDTIAGSLDVALALPPLRGKALEYTIESDTTPTIDRYRVTIVLAGEPEREVRGTLDRGGFHEAPLPSSAQALSYPRAGPVVVLGLVPILAIVAALVLLGAVITVLILKGGKGVVSFLKWGALALAGGGLLVFALSRKGGG